MELFKFEKEDITRHIEYELKTAQKFKEPLQYIVKNLTRLGHSMSIKSLKKIDLNKVKEHEGKNYYWSVFTYKNVTMAVRRYKQHLTIFTKAQKGVDYKKNPKIEYGAFTFHTDFKKFEDKKHDELMDLYHNKPFTGLNEIITDLLKLLTNDKYGVSWVWNSACLKRPDYIKLELAFCGNNISSIDSFAFCMEEIDSFFLQMFAENTMLRKIKEFKNKIGEKLNDQYIIDGVATEVKDDYYHGVGISTIETSNKKEKTFHDVYRLSRWYFKDIFKEKVYFYEGEVYIEDSKFKIGNPVAYKGDDGEGNVILLEKEHLREHFIPLKKF